jgi:thioredoxin-related protein
MTRPIVLAFLLTGFLAFVPASQAAKVEGVGHYEIPDWFKQSFLVLKEDVAEAAAANKRVMIFFHQDGCPYCAQLVNLNFSQKSIVDYTRKHFDSLDINMWGDREVTDVDGKVYTAKTFAAAKKVWFTPTLIFLDEKGNQVLRINGYYPPHRFQTALRYVAEHQESKMSFREYSARANPPKASGKLHAEPYFRPAPYNLKGLGKTRPLIVFFEQKDCPSCDRLHNHILPQKATQALLKKFDSVQLNMWGDTPVTTPDGRSTTARQWASKLGIVYAPSAVLFDGGREVIRIEAFLKAFHVQSVMDYVASGAYKTQPSLQRFIQSRADRLLEHGERVNLWK